MDLELGLQRTAEYAASKGFALKSYFLDCIRRGHSRSIRALLGGPDYIREMEALFGSDLALARLSYTFVWSQAQRAAVEGGLTEESASRIYNRCFVQAQQLTTIRDLAELNVRTLMAWAEAVAATEEDGGLSPLVRRCRMYIREHVYEELTVARIAEAMNFSRSHLAHIFKAETGQTLMAVIQEEKIREATRLVDLTPLSLTEIGLKLGFCSQSHFTKAFRKITGTTPSNYRREHAHDDESRE
jgi:AraC-like DNA-binding protein